MKVQVIIRLFGYPIFLLTVGCTSIYHVDIFPDTALASVNTAITFAQLKESPNSHQGVTLMLAGEVLDARRFKDHTRLTMLQLPMDTDLEPERDRTRSEGRFLAIQEKFLDPATVPKGTRLTIIATVSGSTTEPLDEMDYTYPTLTIQHLKVWPERRYAPFAYYPYGPYPYFYRGPWIVPYGYYPGWWYN